MARIELFAIGASAGGLEALERIVANLPADFPAAICVVVHVAANSPGLIPEIISSHGPLQATHAEDGMLLTGGGIFVAPPDHHLLIDQGGKLRLGRGPKENRFRPAIDPLFRSAARAFEQRAAGIILSGGLDDGVAGLIAIQRCGGAVIVQDPADAAAPSMPLAALRALDPDKQLPADGIAHAMTELATVSTRRVARQKPIKEDLDREISIAAGADSHPIDVLQVGEPSLLTCPDCHGVLVRLRDSEPARYRCHTGHAYTVESLLSAMRDRVENTLWDSIRCLEEYAALLEHAATHKEARQAEDDMQIVREVRRRSGIVRDLVKAEDQEPAASPATPAHPARARRS
ncbi:MAG: chemotaxis protein CheB [Hyphomonadaceae bacterium]